MSRDDPAVPRVILVAAEAEAMAALRPARETLDGFGVAWTEKLVTAGSVGTFDAKGARALIVAAPDATLPAALAASTARPVVRVPIAAGGCEGVALLYDPATADLPAGDVAFATVAIGEAGARNAALFVVSVLGLTDASLWEKWREFRERQTDAVLGLPPLSLS